MDIAIRVKTPGNKLSMKTMLGGVVGDPQKDLELGTFDMLISEFPSASHTQLKKLVSKKAELYLSDIKKGSWEIALVGALGGIIGKAIYDLTIDYVKTSPQWEEFKKRTQAPSKVAADNIYERIEKRNELGPFMIKKRSLRITQSNDGTAKLNVDIELERKNDDEISIETESQINELIKQLESGEYKKISKSYKKDK